MSLAELRALAAETVNGAHQKVWPQPDPAAGADFSITVPSPQFWLPVALRATFTASDTDVDRQMTVSITDGTTTVADALSGTTLGASDVAACTWLRDYPLSGGTPGPTIVVNPFPDVMLPTGWKIVVTTDGIDTTDQWTSIAMTVIQITGGQPAQALRREDAILEHWHALSALLG